MTLLVKLGIMQRKAKISRGDIAQGGDSYGRARVTSGNDKEINKDFMSDSTFVKSK